MKIKPGEPYGTIITDQNGKTYNIEYNVFSKTLEQTGIKDHGDAKGYSGFPGNINCFLVDFESYVSKLRNIN